MQTETFVVVLDGKDRLPASGWLDAQRQAMQHVYAADGRVADVLRSVDGGPLAPYRTYR